MDEARSIDGRLRLQTLVWRSDDHHVRRRRARPRRSSRYANRGENHDGQADTVEHAGYSTALR
jgi:hypothetical protein